MVQRVRLQLRYVGRAELHAPGRLRDRGERAPRRRASSRERVDDARQQDGQPLSSGANLLAFGGYNWVRFDCTASAANVAAQNTDTSLQWNLYDAHVGNDGWKFGGDSITANSMGHQPTNDSFDQLVHARTVDDPAFEMAGHGGWSTATMLANIDAFLANFPGPLLRPLARHQRRPRQRPAAYLANMTLLVNKVLAAGKVPVVPTIPYTAEPAHADIPAYNAQIQALYATYGAQLVKGPDLYTVIYDGRATMFTNPTDCTPTRPETPPSGRPGPVRCSRTSTASERAPPDAGIAPSSRQGYGVREVARDGRLELASIRVDGRLMLGARAEDRADAPRVDELRHVAEEVVDAVVAVVPEGAARRGAGNAERHLPPENGQAHPSWICLAQASISWKFGLVVFDSSQ